MSPLTASWAVVQHVWKREQGPAFALLGDLAAAGCSDVAAGGLAATDCGDEPCWGAEVRACCVSA